MKYKNCLLQSELDKFNALPDINVVFDIGTKDNVEYLINRPELTYHLFEPFPQFFENLSHNVKQGGWRKVFLNNFGIGDASGLLGFSSSYESFDGSEATPNGGGEIMLPIRSLDAYVEEHQIESIDFMKIDTEGFDFKIIKGNPKSLKITKYLQIEWWDDRGRFEELLNGLFTTEDIGGRNLFCTKK